MIYARKTKPHNMIAIINQNSKSNFVEPITKNCDIQLKGPYVLFRDDVGKILGIWFSESSDVNRIFDRIISFIELEKRAVENTGNSNSSSTKLSFEPGNGSNPGDIMSMLSKARNEFDTKNDVNDNSKQSVVAVPSPNVNANNCDKPASNNILTDFLRRWVIQVLYLHQQLQNLQSILTLYCSSCSKELQLLEDRLRS